jgi:hypothetical protein
MDLTTDKLRSLIKKWNTLIEAFVDVKTTDGYLLRVFVIGFTKKQRTQIRKTSYAQRSQVCLPVMLTPNLRPVYFPRAPPQNLPFLAETRVIGVAARPFTPPLVYPNLMDGFLRSRACSAVIFAPR